jgi:hypothetical protein
MNFSTRRAMLVSAALGLAAVPSCSSTDDVEVEGEWAGTWKSDQGRTGGLELSITQSGSSVSGSATITNSPLFTQGTVSGEVQGERVSGTIEGGTASMTFDLEVEGSGGKLTGTYNVNAGSETDSGTLDLVRKIPSSGDGGPGADSTVPAFKDLPLSGDAEGPVVASISLKCEPSCDVGYLNKPCVMPDIGITHPQGLEQVDGVSQKIRLYPNQEGTGQPEEVTFKMSQYGNLSLSSGFFSRDEGKAVRDVLCAASWWPAEIIVADKAAHIAQGKVKATVVK